ncbi:hypothetical protein [Rhodopirellula sallentina]|uniref:hypothetical protein n=1 Tax=Rhodopirellula sallentina TaxID=1263869 RepID=UPI000349819C|nr:hypothetical protein [Rhodopirellula sallentina]
MSQNATTKNTVPQKAAEHAQVDSKEYRKTGEKRTGDESAVSRAVSLVSEVDKQTEELLSIWHRMNDSQRRKLLIAARTIAANETAKS